MTKTMNKLIAIALLAVCLFCAASCAAAPAPTQPSGVDKAAIFDASVKVINSSRPRTSFTTLVYTAQWGDELISTYDIKADGTCDYVIQKFNELSLSDPNAEFIVSTSGTVSATDEAVPVGRINLQSSYVERYDASEENGITTVTVTIKNDRIAAFLTRAVDATDMTVTFKIQNNKLISVSLTYLTENNASVRMDTTYGY